MSALAVVLLNHDQARDLTEEAKADLSRFTTRLLDLYEGDAHTALGYASWAAYCKAEFKSSDATAYRTLQAARVVRQLPIGSPSPATESVARELSPLLSEHADEIPAVWDEAVAAYGPTPTAAEVRAVVQIHSSEDPGPQPDFTHCPTCGHKVRADKPLRLRKETS